MKESQEVVRTADGQEWTFTCLLPESVEEAVEVYGEAGALYLLNAGLKVKEQNIAREILRNGGTSEEANAAVAAYRPGGGTRVSLKRQASQLIVDNAETLRDNPDLREQVQNAFIDGDFKTVVELLG